MFAPSGSCTLSLALALAPLMLGIINRTKAMFAGRRGPALAAAVLRSVEAPAKSRPSTAARPPRSSVAGPIVGCAASLVALLFVPLAASAAVVCLSRRFPVGGLSAWA